MKKIFGLLALAFVGVVFTACDEATGTKQPTGGATVEPTGGNNDVTVTEKTFVATRQDGREAVYTHYTASGEEVDSYASLYTAIFNCVDSGDEEDYVCQEGSDEKLFVNFSRYDENLADMYWWYDGANDYSDYKPYEEDFWAALRDTKLNLVMKNGVNASALNSYNSYKTVAVTADTSKFRHNGVEVWHICTELEASATVDMEAYSGITKSVYKIDLSEARITPPYDGSDDTYAYVGFITADGNYVANVGLRCDTRTGNWYYYSGEASIEASSIEIDDENCYLTSTWDETNKCFKPDGDVTMTMELLTLKDEDGEPYFVHRLTMEFEDGRKVVKDYEDPDLTQCGTIRFTCGLDIVSDNTLTDLMCGSKFENVVIVEATATVYEEMLDELNYGILSEISIAADYNILNSIEEDFKGASVPGDSARFHTIIYNTTAVSYNFDVEGKDVYNFSYDIAPADTTE